MRASEARKEKRTVQWALGRRGADGIVELASSEAPEAEERRRRELSVEEKKKRKAKEGSRVASSTGDLSAFLTRSSLSLPPQMGSKIASRFSGNRLLILPSSCSSPPSSLRRQFAL